MSLCVKSVCNKYIFSQKKCERYAKKFYDFSMTFCQIIIFHDFSRPGFYFFPWFSMIFHDSGHPVTFLNNIKTQSLKSGLNLIFSCTSPVINSFHLMPALVTFHLHLSSFISAQCLQQAMKSPLSPTPKNFLNYRTF